MCFNLLTDFKANNFQTTYVQLNHSSRETFTAGEGTRFLFTLFVDSHIRGSVLTWFYTIIIVRGRQTRAK